MRFASCIPGFLLVATVLSRSVPGRETGLSARDGDADRIREFDTGVVDVRSPHYSRELYRRLDERGSDTDALTAEGEALTAEKKTLEAESDANELIYRREKDQLKGRYRDRLRDWKNMRDTYLAEHRNMQPNERVVYNSLRKEYEEAKKEYANDQKLYEEKLEELRRKREEEDEEIGKKDDEYTERYKEYLSRKEAFDAKAKSAAARGEISSREASGPAPPEPKTTGFERELYRRLDKRGSDTDALTAEEEALKEESAALKELHGNMSRNVSKFQQENIENEEFRGRYEARLMNWTQECDNGNITITGYQNKFPDMMKKDEVDKLVWSNLLTRKCAQVFGQYNASRELYEKKHEELQARQKEGLKTQEEYTKRKNEFTERYKEYLRRKEAFDVKAKSAAARGEIHSREASGPAPPEPKTTGFERGGSGAGSSAHSEMPSGSGAGPDDGGSQQG